MNSTKFIFYFLIFMLFIQSCQDDDYSTINNKSSEIEAIKQNKDITESTISNHTSNLTPCYISPTKCKDNKTVFSLITEEEFNSCITEQLLGLKKGVSCNKIVLGKPSAGGSLHHYGSAIPIDIEEDSPSLECFDLIKVNFKPSNNITINNSPSYVFLSKKDIGWVSSLSNFLYYELDPRITGYQQYAMSGDQVNVGRRTHFSCLSDVRSIPGVYVHPRDLDISSATELY